MNHWPEIPYEGWRETQQTLHRWMQIVGKIKVAKVPWVNHSWSSAFYVTPNGLTTSIIYDEEAGAFSMDFDFLDHAFVVRHESRGETRIPLIPESVASFHDRCFKTLVESGIRAAIVEQPNEIAEDLLLCDDHEHRAYDPEAASRYAAALRSADQLMKLFRVPFIGKCSPVHFFWGSFDLAVTRFSGRKAPLHPGGVPHLPDRITREAYSHEVSSCGFWPGNEVYPAPAFYSYAYPAPPSFDSASILPHEASFNPLLKEFILPYEEVRKSKNSERLVLEFFHSTYEAAAVLGDWPREDLEGGAALAAIHEVEPHRRLLKNLVG